jgi:hypothetical protein
MRGSLTAVVQWLAFKHPKPGNTGKKWVSCNAPIRKRITSIQIKFSGMMGTWNMGKIGQPGWLLMAIIENP